MSKLTFIDSTGKLSKKPTDNPYYQSVISFLEDFRTNPQIIVKTSGSTGTPKEIIIKKEQIIASVHQTAAAFNLTSEDIAFCSLPVDYIAGKLMLLRAEILGLDVILIEPSSNPFQNFNAETIEYFLKRSGKFLFAFVPYQLNTIVNDAKSVELLKTAKVTLSGGAPLNSLLEQQLTELNSPIYETYGMTETVTHVAIRKISGTFRSQDYYFLTGVEHRVSQYNTLSIKGLVTNNEWVHTNDIIEYTGENTFRMIGRADNVINSAGVKLHPELIEQNIQQVFSREGISNKFFCFGIPDKKLGQSLVLFVESKARTTHVSTIQKLLKDRLSKYEVPKEIILVENFVYTSSNKLNRNQTAQQYLK